MENPKFVFDRKDLRRLRREPTIAIIDHADSGDTLRATYNRDHKTFIFELECDRVLVHHHVDAARNALWQAATGAPAPEVAGEPRRTVRVDLNDRGEMPRGKMSDPAPEVREWIACDERLPEIEGAEAADEWLESGNRHIWAAVKGGSHAWIMTAFAVRHAREHNSATGYFGRPDFWMEANAPKPPQ